jgi:hypothetical protein
LEGKSVQPEFEEAVRLVPDGFFILLLDGFERPGAPSDSEDERDGCRAEAKGRGPKRAHMTFASEGQIRPARCAVAGDSNRFLFVQRTKVTVIQHAGWTDLNGASAARSAEKRG